jgi:hypothetical protein
MQVSRRDFLRGTAVTVLALSKPTFQLIEGARWEYAFGGYLLPSGGDDTAMINAAIRAAPPGETVILGPGVFNISGTINLFGGSGLPGTCDENNIPTNTLVKNGNPGDPVIRGSGDDISISNINITCPDGPAIEYLPSWIRPT